MSVQIPAEPQQLSACHQAPVVLCEGTEFDVKNIRNGSTYYYGCSECREGCDLYAAPVSDSELKAIIHRINTGGYLENGGEEQALVDIKRVITSRDEQQETNLLFDLDEIDNKPWRVFRQLKKLVPECIETYARYEEFYSHGGGLEVMQLIQKSEALSPSNQILGGKQ